MNPPVTKDTIDSSQNPHTHQHTGRKRLNRALRVILVAASLLPAAIPVAQATETIGGGSIASPAVAPQPAYGIGGIGFVPVKNWNFGSNGTIKNYTDMNANFYYHDNFGQIANPNYAAYAVAPDAANAIGTQPIEGVNTTGPVRQFFTDSMKTYLLPLNGATTLTTSPINCGSGAFMPKWTLPNGGSLLGQDIIWETRVRYVTPPYFWFAIWCDGDHWSNGAEMDLIESFGYDNGGGSTNFDGRYWHSDMVGHTESTNYLSGSWAGHMAEYGFTSFDATQWHTWTWLYRKDNTFVAYLDGRPVQDGYTYWTISHILGGTPINMSFLFDPTWSSNTVGGLMGKTLPASSLVGTYYEWDYSRVYLRAGTGGDIGLVGISGSDSVNSSGIYTVTASGADISGTADAFHYGASRTVTGDCTITARVDSLTHTDDWAKAGVMMRDILANDPGAPNAMMLIPALAQARFQSRTTSGATTNVIDLADGWALNEGFTDGARTNGTDALDTAWYTLGAPTISIVNDSAGIGSGNALQLAATGSTGRGIVAGFPAQTLADGDSITLSFNWRFTGTIGLNQANSLRYGLHSSNGTPVTADNTTQSDNDKGYFVMTNPGAAGTATTLKRETGGAPGVLGGTDWSGLGTAGASVSGSTVKHTSTIVITRSGSNLVVSASIDNLAAATGTDSVPVTYTFDQFGITLAGATLPSPILIDNIQVGDGMASNISPPNWVKLNRTGNVFTGYYSPDGTTWTQVGSQTFAMGTTMYVGLAATSHNNASLATATFSNVKLDPFFTSRDIGAVGVTGSDSLISGTYSISGGGLGNNGVADSCRYLSQTLIGDGTITARVNSVTAADYGSLASLMMRDDLPETGWGALTASFAIPKLSTAKLVTRTALNTAPTSIVGATIHPPMWARLSRAGNVFTGSYSSDGITWTTVGSQTVTMGQKIKVGIAVSANSTTATATAVIDNVTVTGVRGL